MWMGVLLFGLLLAGTASAETLTGRASVVDGDTIEIAGERVRLHGIDAPEGRQQCRDADGRPWHCGREAAFALDEFLAQSRPTHCSLLDRDRWGRFVATCIRNDSMDVNEWLVKHGWAQGNRIWNRLSAPTGKNWHFIPTINVRASHSFTVRS